MTFSGCWASQSLTLSANSSICFTLGTLWSSIMTRSTRLWKWDTSYVRSLHRLYNLYLSLCLVSKKAATFSIGFLYSDQTPELGKLVAMTRFVT